MRLAAAMFTQSQIERLNHIASVITNAVNVECIILISFQHAVCHKHSVIVKENELEEKLHLIFLVIVGSGYNQSDDNAQDMIEGRCRKFANVTAIVHKMSYIKPLLEKRHPFFSTVLEDGLSLYETELGLKGICNASNESFIWSTPEQSWEKWCTNAQTFLLGAQFFLEKELYKTAAFMLQQVAEHTLIGVIQAYTGYRAQTHNIDKLLRYAEVFTSKLITIFPRNTSDEVELFKSLNGAYIGSRYKDDYEISCEKIAVLIDRVKVLHKIADEMCRDKIGSLEVNLQRIGQP